MAVPTHGPAERHVSFERERGVYRVDTVPDVAHVVVTLGTSDAGPDDVLRVFRALSDEAIPIFLIKLHGHAVSFAVDGAFVGRVEACLRGLDLEGSVRRDLALVSVVATSMRDLTGVMTSIADSLQAAGARLYAVGDSHNTVQCLIAGSRADAASQQLRLTFGLEESHS